MFRSDDGGESWELNRQLWDDPRREEWFGGGADHPGIHSICVDPRDSRHVVLGVSCGGVWSTRDGGKTWQPGGKGMRAEYMPPERQFDPNIQDPHIVAQCRANPDVFWVQHHNLVYRHALDVDESGNGSTTGSLWITEDAGDSWRLLSSNLPPIHAVRFEKMN